MMIHYVIYSVESFRIAQKGYCPENMIPAVPDHLHAIITKKEYDLLDGVDATFNPSIEEVEITPSAQTLFSANAQWEIIRATRDALRESPVTLDNGWRIDADKDSIAMMEERLEQWGVGTATMVDGKQMWKGADNDVRYFSQTEFAALIDDARTKRAIKVDANFAYAEQIRAQLPIADDHPAFNPSSWPG